MTNKEPVTATYVLLSFNQVRYVQQAIDAALVQDYKPLQIVFSDDGSTDGTWEIIEKAVRRYRGSHEVFARRSPRNRGVLLHLLDVAKIVKGDVLIVGAGDDVSLPSRVTALMNRWAVNRPAALYSAALGIDENGSRLPKFDKPSRPFLHPIDNCFKREFGVAIFGCSAAYSVDVLRGLPKIEETINFEDYFLALYLAVIRAHVEFCDEPLVLYRMSATALSNSHQVELDQLSQSEIEAKIEKLERGKLQALLAVKTLLRSNQIFGARLSHDENTCLSALESQLSYNATWRKLQFLERAEGAIRNRSGHSVWWLLSRIAGKEFTDIASVLRRKYVHLSPFSRFGR